MDLKLIAQTTTQLPDLSGFSGGLFRNAGEPSTRLTQVISNLVAILTIFGGLAFLTWFVIGAVAWTSSGGNPEQMNKAKSQMSTAIEGGRDFARYIAIFWQFMVIVGGLAVLLYLIWGALDWIFAGNNPDRMTRAKTKLFDGIFGLVLLVLSYLIIKIISTVTGLDILNPAWPTL